ncbi:MAG: hypothetical protein V9E84_06470 [Trichococcus flocculiformis]
MGWIRELFDRPAPTYDRLGRDTEDTVTTLMEQLEFGPRRGWTACTEAERARSTPSSASCAASERARKLYGTVYEDIVALKYLHQRCTNYLAWLTWSNR